MKARKAGLVVYGLVLVCLAFVLGFLLGHGSGVTNVTVSSSPPHVVEEIVVEETEKAADQAALSEPTQMNPLDLNTATAEELDLLPGIGPELAKRIVEYRQTNGKFVAKEQIMDVKGIGEKRYAEIEPLIRIGGTQ